VPGVSKDTGLEVLDLDTNPEFTARSLHTRDVCVQMEGLRRLTQSFVQNPDTILQELVNAAVDLCGVSQRFFDIMGIEAPLVTDGILLPWQVEETRGTIFILAHGRTAAFDNNDGQMMRVLADFAAMAVRYQQLQRALLQQAKIAAGAAMANKLAHQINNPLQSLMNVVYLAAEGQSGQSAAALARNSPSICGDCPPS
jgi:transcriptional regulator with GAF, ATPase, and Fis domain